MCTLADLQLYIYPYKMENMKSTNFKAKILWNVLIVDSSILQDATNLELQFRRDWYWIYFYYLNIFLNYYWITEDFVISQLLLKFSLYKWRLARLINIYIVDNLQDNKYN